MPIGRREISQDPNPKQRTKATRGHRERGEVVFPREHIVFIFGHTHIHIRAYIHMYVSVSNNTHMYMYISITEKTP